MTGGPARPRLAGLALCALLSGLVAGCDPGETGADDGPPAGIIILGGTLNPFVEGAGPNQTLPPDRRTAAGIALAERYPGLPVYYAGRENAPGPVPWLRAAGIPDSRITWEPHSRTTAENARFAVPILHPRPGRPWLLVTSAWHMRRADACFRRAGFHVKPHPVAEAPSHWSLDLRRQLYEAADLAFSILIDRCAPDAPPRPGRSKT